MSGYKFFDPEYDDFLMHYGVPGQKRGVRNYQFKDGTWTELGKERRRIGEGRRVRNLGNTAKPFRKPLSKKDIEFYKRIRYDLNEVNKPDPSNPLDTPESEGRKNNCPYCAVAYELRQKGYYNAKAKFAIDGRSDEAIAKVFGKTKFDTFDATDKYGFCKQYVTAKKEAKSYKELWEGLKKSKFSLEEAWKIEDELRSQGNGARGIMKTVKVAKGRIIGHVYNYEIYDNLVYGVDSQDKSFHNTFPNSFKNAFAVSYLRTDNLNVDEKVAEMFLGQDLKRKV